MKAKEDAQDDALGPLLSRQEAAKYLGISLRKLDELAATGKIPFQKFGESRSSRVLFARRDLDRYIESCRVLIQ